MTCIVLEDYEPIEFCTTSGWCDFIAWTETLGDSFASLKKFASEGGTDDDADAVRKQLAAAPTKGSPEGVIEAIRELIDTDTGKSLIITNGWSSGDDDDDDDDSGECYIDHKSAEEDVK